MKKIKLYTLLLTAFGWMASGCSSLLDENPEYSQNQKVVFSNTDNAFLALKGVYGYMTAQGAYGQMWQENTILASGLSWTQRSGDLFDIASFQMLPTNGSVSSMWNGMYKVVGEANGFIHSLSNSSLPEEDKHYMESHARFLRAWAYYQLTTAFGSVPLKTIASTSDGISSPRTDEKEIYSFVVTELEDIVKLNALPEVQPVGLASMWTVKAFLAKAYHKMACLGYDASTNLQQAKKYFDEVYQAHAFSLEKDLKAQFAPYVATSKEAIFQLNFSIDNQSYFNRSTNRFAPSASTSGIAWGTISSTMAAYDLNYGTYPDDPRLKVNFLTAIRNRAGNNQANPKAPIFPDGIIRANDSTFFYPYFAYGTLDSILVKPKDKRLTPIRKSARLPYGIFADKSNPGVDELANYQNVDTLYQKAVRKAIDDFNKAGSRNGRPWFNKMYDITAIGNRSHLNLMVYRYAEFLLLMADTYNELGESQQAIALANEVLTRARGMEKNAKQPANWAAGLSQEQIREKLYYERIIELIGEPSSFEMARLKGVNYFKSFLERLNRHELTINAEQRYKSNVNTFYSFTFGGGTLTDDYVRRAMYFPIPQSEINNNPGISDQDNNFGYAATTVNP